jgi:hypothetical protein
MAARPHHSNAMTLTTGAAEGMPKPLGFHDENPATNQNRNPSTFTGQDQSWRSPGTPSRRQKGAATLNASTTLAETTYAPRGSLKW